MTLQHTSERRPTKIDLNLLPSEFRPAKKSKLGLILYVTAILLAVAAAFLIFMKSSVDSDSKSLESELNGVQQQLTALQANKVQADGITSQITAIQNQLATAKADDLSAHNDTIYWSEVLSEVDDLVPRSKITLSGIGTETGPSGGSVTLSGTATKKTYAYNLIVDVNASDFFWDIEFTFGDCQELCSFEVSASVTNMSEMEGGSSE